MTKAITALLLFLALTNNAAGQTVQLKNRQLVDMLFTKLNPNLPENSYLPTLAKEKLWWMIVQYNSKPRRILISKIDRWAEGNLDVIATTTNNPGQIPEITVSAEAIGSTASHLTLDQLKDLFLAAMTHEVIHSERHLRSDAAFEDKFQEELRTWSVWIPQVIRPLVKIGHHTAPDWEIADIVLRSCKDDPTCPAFMELVRQHTKK